MDKLLDINAAADFLGISPWTVRAAIRDRKLNPVRIGRRVLLEQSELGRFVAANKQPSYSPTCTTEIQKGSEEERAI